MLRLKLFMFFLRDNLKTLVFVGALLILFLGLALETAFPKLASSGEGVVIGFHVLETNTGSETKLKVEYRGYSAIGEFYGSPLPAKGDVVEVIHQKSLILQRDIFSFK